MAWNARDVVRLKNFLDSIDDVSPIDDGPGTFGDVEETLNIEPWVHSIITQ